MRCPGELRAPGWGRPAQLDHDSGPRWRPPRPPLLRAGGLGARRRLTPRRRRGAEAAGAEAGAEWQVLQRGQGAAPHCPTRCRPRLQRSRPFGHESELIARSPRAASRDGDYRRASSARRHGQLSKQVRPQRAQDSNGREKRSG